MEKPNIDIYDIVEEARTPSIKFRRKVNDDELDKLYKERSRIDQEIEAARKKGHQIDAALVRAVIKRAPNILVGKWIVLQSEHYFARVKSVTLGKDAYKVVDGAVKLEFDFACHDIDLNKNREVGRGKSDLELEISIVDDSPKYWIRLATPEEAKELQEYMDKENAKHG
jgi:hypothetical protein